MAAPGRILVVGGGLIGTEVALLARGAGREAGVLTRSVGQRLSESAAEAGIDVVEAEVGTGSALAEAALGAEAIVCLAGSSTPSVAASDPDGALLGSLSPVLAVLETARDAGIGRVIVASSGGTVYGAGAATPTPEDEPLRPSSLHGVNYLAVESFADFYRRERGMDVSVLRFSNVFGPGAEPRRGQGVIAAWLRAIALGRRPVLIGPGSVQRDFIYVSDAAEAVLAALDAPAGVYNVGGGETLALEELLERIRAATGRSFEIDARPGRGVDLPVTHLDIARIQAATGWSPRTTIERGLEATWEWETR